MFSRKDKQGTKEKKIYVEEKNKQKSIENKIRHHHEVTCTIDQIKICQLGHKYIFHLF